ncbi:hypothetical protein, partial [Klebsiella pneumoniae]
HQADRRDSEKAPEGDELMKVKGIPFNRVKESLLNSPEAIRAYQRAVKELSLVEILYDMR